MIDLEREYEEIKEHRIVLDNELKRLENDPKVKKYINYKNQREKLNQMEISIYKTLKNEEYSSCNHILVFSMVNHDLRGRTYKTCGCIKCGLNEEVLSKDKKSLSFKESVMEDFLKKNNSYLKGKRIYVQCDLSLGEAIYSKIKNTNPDISDDLAIKYFERSLAHIRKNKVSEDRKVSRAKRLSLEPDFSKWNEKDVIID